MWCLLNYFSLALLLDDFISGVNIILSIRCHTCQSICRPLAHHLKKAHVKQFVKEWFYSPK